MSSLRYLSQLGKDTFLYGAGDALQKVIQFLLFPIYTRLLTQSDFGVQDLIFTAITVMSSLLVLGLDAGTARYYYDADTLDAKKKILSTWLWFGLFVSLPACSILIVFAKPICSFVFKDADLASFFIIGTATLPFASVAGVTMMTLRLTFHAKGFSLLSASGVLLHGLAALYFVVILGQGVAGVFLAFMLATIYRALFGLLLTYKHFGFTFSWSWLRPLLRFGLPLVPAGLSLWVLNYSNRYFLLSADTLSDIGLLSVGFRISSLLGFVIIAFQTAWGPFAFSLLKDKEIAGETYSKVLTYFILISLTLTVILSVLSREAIMILATDEYEQSAVLVPWLCYGAIAWGAYYIVGIGYSIAKKSYHTTLATLAAGLATTIFNFWLIPSWGIFGAAVASMIGNFTALTYGLCVGQHYFHVSYQARKIFLLVILATAAIASGLYIDRFFSTWEANILIPKFLLAAAFIVALVVFRILSTKEIRSLWNSLFKPASVEQRGNNL